MGRQKTISVKRKRIGFVLLAILLWVGLAVLLTHRFSVPYFFCFLHPFTVIEVFLLQWFDLAWLITDLLVILPLIGWLLLYRDIRTAGLWLLIGPQCLILAADAIITPLHLINDMSLYTVTVGRIPTDLGTIALFGLVSAVFPVAVIILTFKWKPNTKF